MPHGVRVLAVCPFCEWPKRAATPPDNAARHGLELVLADRGVDAVSDEVLDHVVATHRRDEDLGFPDD
jgi:hypothetical protein